MKIKSLKLHNFRNYEQLQLTFSDNLNIIYGDNGVGKTNLVEAIYVLALTKSFRINDDKKLIRTGIESTKIEGSVEVNTTNDYQVIINKEGKKVKIDNNLILRLSEYISNINIILLEPEEQIIFKSSPASRRKLLNIEISQLEKDYIIYLNNYNKILKQRNFYLRELYINGNASQDYLDILTKKLVEYGLKIYAMRNKFIENINTFITEKYVDIFTQGEVMIKYNSDYKNKTEEEIINNYRKNYHKEVTIGKTLFGIHHDDITFLLDHKDIGEWGSNGQQKNAIFAFKLAEIEVFKAIKGNYPILILDDLFSALDKKKIKNILSLLDNEVQTFITTTELNKINRKLLSNAKIFNVQENLVREVS